MRVYTVIEIVNNIFDLYPCGIGSIVLMYKNATPIPMGKYLDIGGKMCGSLLEKYRHKNVLSVYRDCHETRTDYYLVLDLLEEQDMGIHLLYQREPSFKLTIGQVNELKQCYGGETTIDQMLAHVQGKKTHRCPKCDGTGYIVETYNAAEPWECCEQLKERKVTCDLCNGEGYTEHEYKPRMVQDGWERTGV